MIWGSLSWPVPSLSLFCISFWFVKLFPMRRIVSRQVWPRQWCEPRMGAPSSGWVRPSICARRQIFKSPGMVRARSHSESVWFEAEFTWITKEWLQQMHVHSIAASFNIWGRTFLQLHQLAYLISFLHDDAFQPTRAALFLYSNLEKTVRWSMPHISMLSTHSWAAPGGHCGIHLGKSI